MRRVLISMEKKITDRHLDVDADIPDEPILVLGDNDMITQVIYNLLENATKFAYEGSTLYLGVHADGRQGAGYGAQSWATRFRRRSCRCSFERFHKSDKSRSEDKDGVRPGALHRKDHFAAAQGRNQCDQRGRRDHLHLLAAPRNEVVWISAQPRRLPGEVIEEYRRALPREVVEVYSRPLPWLAKPASPRKAPRRRGKRLGHLAGAAGTGAAADCRSKRRWPRDPVFPTGQATGRTPTAPIRRRRTRTPRITIPTAKPAADVRLTLAREHGQKP